MEEERPRLSRATLARLPDEVACPGYELAAIRPGIVHLGLGNFHRAHMARYADALMARDPSALRWGIVGAGLLPADRATIDALTAQDGLYTLVERDAASECTRVIGSLAGSIFAGEDSAALLAAIHAPDVRIVSLTITEHGYCLDRATKRLDLAHPLITTDLAAPHTPRSAVGIVVEALRRRCAAGRPAFTALSCDNIQHNGAVLAQTVADFAEALDPKLADWISGHARFPSTMVDRITPATRAADAAALARRLGLTDASPVFSETFAQWVIEDDFADGRPPWDRVGAQFVIDVAPYESMKLRLLNASHLAIAAPGRLMGYTYIDDLVRNSLVERYMRALMDRETGPTLDLVPGIDLAAYKDALVARFANPTIKDTVERVNTDAPLNYLLDPIRDRLATGASIQLLAFAVAAWIRRIRGVDEAGAPVDVRHPLAAELRDRASAGGADPRPVLGLATLFGTLGNDPRFIAPVEHWLTGIYRNGTAATLVAAAAGLDF